ncbi:hypothetical protein VPH35_016850 [Triticum aestivum]
MSCNRDSETDRVFPREGISFVDRESLSWAKLGHPCRVLSFESRARGYVADENLLMSGCRELDTSREKEYPSLTVRAYHGLSWDTPAGYYLSKAVPAVMWQMRIC